MSHLGGHAGRRLRFDVAYACAFFAAEEAGYVTAQVLGVNGGAAV